MAGIFRQSFDEDSNAQETELLGGTSQTKIGNVGDRLKVDANFSSVPTTSETELATYVINLTGIAIGNGKSMASILNAVNSTKVLKIRGIKIINTQNTAVTGVVADFRLFRMTGHSVGTSVTPEIHDLNDALDGNITIRTGGTIAGESSTHMYRWLWSTDEWGVGSVDVESTDHTNQNLHATYSQFMKTKPLTIRGNQGFTLKQITNSSVGTFDIQITYTLE